MFFDFKANATSEFEVSGVSKNDLSSVWGDSLMFVDDTLPSLTFPSYIFYGYLDILFMDCRQQVMGIFTGLRLVSDTGDEISMVRERKNQ